MTGFDIESLYALLFLVATGTGVPFFVKVLGLNHVPYLALRLLGKALLLISLIGGLSLAATTLGDMVYAELATTASTKVACHQPNKTAMILSCQDNTFILSMQDTLKSQEAITAVLKKQPFVHVGGVSYRAYVKSPEAIQIELDGVPVLRQ